MPSAAIFFFVLPFISWLLVAGILYVFSRLFSGTGSFPVTLQNCGYGYLPNTLFSVIVIINSFAVTWSMGTSFMLLTRFLLVVGIISFFLNILERMALDRCNGKNPYPVAGQSHGGARTRCSALPVNGHPEYFCTFYRQRFSNTLETGKFHEYHYHLFPKR